MSANAEGAITRAVENMGKVVMVREEGMKR